MTNLPDILLKLKALLPDLEYFWKMDPKIETMYHGFRLIAWDSEKAQTCLDLEEVDGDLVYRIRVGSNNPSVHTIRCPPHDDLSEHGRLFQDTFINTFHES